MHFKDRKAKLPAQSRDLSRPVQPVCCSTSPNASSATSSSLSSSSLSYSSSPDFFGIVQAAFKRHRPLCPPQSNNIRPMRMVPPQREVPRRLASKMHGRASQNVSSGDIHSRKYPVSLTKNTTSVDGDFQKDIVSNIITNADEVNYTAVDIPQNPYKTVQRNNEASSLLVGSHYTRETAPFWEENITCKQGSDCPNDTIKLSSHLGSLALTEMELDVKNPPDASTVINPDTIPPNYDTNTEANFSHTQGGGIHSLLSKGPTDSQDRLNEFQNVLQSHASHPTTQSSMVGSCVTSSLINSSSAPMVSSTKDCFQSHPDRSNLGNIYCRDLDPNPQHITEGCVTSSSLIHLSSAPIVSSTTDCFQSLPEGSSHLETKSYGDLDSNPHPITQDEALLLPKPSSKCTSALPVDPSDSAAAQSSSSAIVTEAKNSPAMGQHDCNTKEIDISKEPCPIDSKMNQEKGTDCDIQPQDPFLIKSSKNVKLESSKSVKEEKAVIPKEASLPRKRSHDPDLFFRVNGKLYQRLGKIGSGGSSEVHKVISSNCTIYALKKIKLKGRDYATAYGFCQEIVYLNKLKGKNYIIQLIDYEVTDKTLLQDVLSGSIGNKERKFKDDGFIYMLLEYGEIDLSRMLSLKWEELEGSGQLIDENWLRFYWQQILLAVNTIHEERIVHSDLKPANFLLVKGSLKLIDFGIAKAIMNDTTHIQRDLQVGTLSYMSPEAFMCNERDKNGNIIKCGRPSDIWSLGCILFQMVYGRTPFSEYTNFWSKFQVITNPDHTITYDPLPNPCLSDLMQRCLSWDMIRRWRIPELLKHPFMDPTQRLHNDDETLRLYNHLNDLILRHPPDHECCELFSEISKCCLQIKYALSKSPNH